MISHVRDSIPHVAKSPGVSMFDSLDEQMKQDEREQVSTKERLLRYITIGAVSVIFFGGLVVAVQHLQ